MDSSTTPATPLKSLSVVNQYGNLASMLYQMGAELRNYYDEQLALENDEGRRILLLNDRNRASVGVRRFHDG